MTGHGDSLDLDGRDSFPAWLRWARDFPGDAGHVRQARHWAKAILPACPPLDDVAEIVSELATNAVTHTGSNRPGGRFDIELAWSPGLVRVICGDQGAPTAPRLIEEAGGTGGRGLLIVDGLSQTWGIAGDPAGRWVWADMLWPGGPPAQVPADSNAIDVELARLRHAYVGLPIWYELAAGTWWAALPEVGGVDELIRAPSLAVLDRVLARRRVRPLALGAAHVLAGAGRDDCHLDSQGPQ